MGLSNALNNRPIRVLGFITAYHSFGYGLGYLTGLGGFDGALIGISVDSELITRALGISLLLVGGILMFGFLRQNPNTIKYISYAQSAIWLFVTFMYLFNGAFILAFAVGFVWACISGYIAYASKNRENIIAYDRSARAEQETRDEDQPWHS